MVLSWCPPIAPRDVMGSVFALKDAYTNHEKETALWQSRIAILEKI
jgi:hypothetical protein